MLGILQGIIPNSLTAFALTQISAGLTAIIQACVPLVVAVLAHLMLTQDRLTPQRAFGVSVGLAGMALLVGPAAIEGGTGHASGAIAMLLVVASYAHGAIYIRTIPAAEPI